MKTIAWATDMKETLAKAQEIQKPVMLDFFNPGWIGCQQMDAVTYPKKTVVDFLNESMVPVRIPFDDPLSQKFNITWIPALVCLDWNGTEHYRTVGFMAPDDLIPSLLIGYANVYGNLGHFDTAFGAINKILSDYPESDAASEAVFMRGVFGYKSTHDPAPLKEAYKQLAEQYPDTIWTKRAAPYRLL